MTSRPHPIRRGKPIRWRQSPAGALLQQSIHAAAWDQVAATDQPPSYLARWVRWYWSIQGV